MFKKIGLLITCLLFLILGKVTPVYSSEVNSKILIVYDSYNVYGNTENILNTINIMAMKTGDKVEIKNMNFYKSVDTNSYGSIILIHNGKEKLPNSLKIDLKKFKGKQIGIGIDIKGLNLSIEDIINEPIKTEYEIIKYIKGNEKLSHNKYLVIDNVNAFMDLNKLVDEAEYLSNIGIPFILNVKPVYINTNLGAMQRFAEALRYAQSKGGYVILDTPYIEEESKVTTKEIVDAMVVGYSKLIDYYVYPMAISIPVNLIYKGDMNPFIEESNTLFLRNTKTGALNFSKFEDPKVENLITLFDYTGKENIESISSSSDTAISIKSDVGFEEFKNNINLVTQKVNFEDPGNLELNIKIEGKEISVSELGIYLNGVDVTQNRFISNEEFKKIVGEDTKDKGKIEESANFDIGQFSNVVMIFAGIACVIFIIIAILSRRIDRKKYFK